MAIDNALLAGDPVDHLIAEDIITNVNFGELTIQGLANKYHVHTSRISNVAKAVLDLREETRYQDAKGAWVTRNAAQEALGGISRTVLNRAVWYQAKHGKPIRQRRHLTTRYPLGGEIYFSLNDLCLALPQVASRVAIKNWVESFFPKAGDRPQDLDLGECSLLLALMMFALQGKPWPSIEKIAKKYGFGSRPAVNGRLLSLQQKGYIQFRKWSTKRPFEYRFLNGPTLMMEALAARRPELVLPFNEEGDA